MRCVRHPRAPSAGSYFYDGRHVPAVMGRTYGDTADGGWRTALWGWAALFALGMVGVVALALTVAPQLAETPGLESAPYPLLVVVAGLNSALLLAVFVALGTLAAPRLDLRSHVYDRATRGRADWGAFRKSAPMAAALGAGLFVLAALLEVAFSPFVTVAAEAPLTDAETLRALAASVPLRLLYGGVTEELLLRWGVMAPLAWLLWRARGLRGRRPETPSAETMWAAIVLAAVLFGVGHLPALASTYGLQPGLVARTVLLNGVVGVGLGWLFWRRSLEAAMVAHASFHVALLAVSTAIVVLT